MTGDPVSAGRRFRLGGVDLGYPVRFRGGSSMMGIFPVRLDHAERLLADTPFRPAAVAPGRALLSLNCVHYTDTDVGPYEEVALALVVQHVPSVDRRSRWAGFRSGDVPTHTWRLGVTTPLSRDCGRVMWGFPKDLEPLRWDRTPDRATMTWWADDATDEVVLRFSVPARGRRRPRTIAPPVYTCFEGRPHVGRLRQSYAGRGHHVSGAVLEVGSGHPVTDELRSLGLPRRPWLTLWNEDLDFTMSAPEPISVH